MAISTRYSSNEILRMLPKLTRAVIETVKESPDGAPETVLFLAFEAQGVSLETFNKFMTVLTNAQFLEKKGHLYFLGPKGRVLH